MSRGGTPRRRKPRVAQDQGELLPDESEQVWWRCHGIFSPSYLRGPAVSQHLPAPDEVRGLHERISKRWSDSLPALGKRDESFTRSEFLDATLADLGWHFIPGEKLPKPPTWKKPDYCLYPDEQTKQSVAAGDPAAIFRASSTVLEAKKYDHPLDRVSERETPGRFPSEQIQDYLTYAKDAAGRFFNWAILTNGDEWRLYCEQAAPAAYFSFHLARGSEFCSLEEFRLFAALFRPRSLHRDPQGRCFLDDLREGALTHQVKLEENLRNRVFDVLEDLAGAFYFSPDNNLTQSHLPAVYQTSLIFLYRLLFVLYAESRDLLPVRRTGAGARTTYLHDYSLSRLVARLRDTQAFAHESLPDLYEELLRLFHLVNGTYPARNRSLNVTRYNGGLFDPKQHPQIEQWRVGDAKLADVLRQLIFAQPPARRRSSQQRIFTDETIDYATLEVRQLGDIYEGLLGAHLARSNGHLQLLDDRGQSHREGIVYTPDWVVRYLVRTSLQPLLDEIEQTPEVAAAIAADSRDNSFAEAVLALNIVDPAMGSGHFLVRATEFLADQIVRHPTTKRMTDQIIAAGDRRRRREDILGDGLIPVSPGVAQETAEIAYWRRRVVECCIYGVDTNPLAVELAKLALWLTCISIDEPLNFLDHHLRCGNSLLSVHPHELHQAPAPHRVPEGQLAIDVAPQLADALSTIIQETARIEEQASTDLEIVKDKEERWRRVRANLDPFLQVSDVWLAALDGTPVQPEEYRLLALYLVSPDRLAAAEKRRARTAFKALKPHLDSTRHNLNPFHWHLEFPEVFFQENGTPRPPRQRGFDAVLGNPPYVSTHTSAEQAWRPILQRRAGYLEDLYLHFTDLGFSLLRPGGAFGFIVSDTFFTLETKRRMRELLQANSILALGQCDPFPTFVDAAIFVARKQAMPDDDSLLFIQARRLARGGRRDKQLPDLPPLASLAFTETTSDYDAAHGTQGCLRLHTAPIRIYRQAHKQAFFEPRPCVLELYGRFNDPVKKLVAQWWDRISTSERFAQNLPTIRTYHATLKPGDITLVGLIAEGGEGIATANNSRFLGYLERTPQAEAIAASREQWTRAWVADPRIRPVFLGLLRQNGGDPGHPTADSAAWEACIEPLKAKFSPRDLGFRRTDLYRLVPQSLVAADQDFQYTWQQRRAELLALWQGHPDLAKFWQESDVLETLGVFRVSLRKAEDLSEELFSQLFRELAAWLRHENQSRRRSRQPPIHLHALGLRSGEDYSNSAGAPRIAVIYNGLRGRAQWVPFRKSDPQGHKWITDDPLFIHWAHPSVEWLFANSGKTGAGMPVVRNPHLYFRPSVTWSRTANHTDAKARLLPPCVFDADSPVLAPDAGSLSTLTLLALVNSNVFSFFCKKLLNHTNKYEPTDLRMMPLVIPTRAQARRVSELAAHAIEAKRLTFTNQPPPNELVSFCRQLAQHLSAAAPPYLRPPAQLQVLDTPERCLAIIELAVNWEAEKLYGVEALGPFDEF